MKKIIFLTVTILLLLTLASCKDSIDKETASPGEALISTTPVDTVQNATTTENDITSTPNDISDTSDNTDIWENALYKEEVTLGEGQKTISIIVKVNEHSVKINVRSDAEMLGQALKDVNLIEGTESEYGLYVKKVNGITADYDLDMSYWSLLKDGTLTPEGADSTVIADGDTFVWEYTIYQPE